MGITPNATSYPFSYTYDRNLLTLALPAQTQNGIHDAVGYTYNDISQPIAVSATSAGAATTTANGIAYAPHGALTQVDLNPGIYGAFPETTTYNPRLQMATVQASGALSLSYDYGS